VALLLHYLFLAAFSWMLCEGLLIFLLLYLVFYKGFFKEWKFFTCLGWGMKYISAFQMANCFFAIGLPIPIVVISVAVSHEQYGTSKALVQIPGCTYLLNFPYRVDAGYQIPMELFGHSLLQ